MLSKTDIDTFWIDVERHLQADEPAATPEQRLRAIIEYRNALAEAEVTNMVYHREAREVARDIEVGEFLVNQRQRWLRTPKKRPHRRGHLGSHVIRSRSRRAH